MLDDFWENIMGIDKNILNFFIICGGMVLSIY